MLTQARGNHKVATLKEENKAEKKNMGKKNHLKT